MQIPGSATDLLWLLSQEDLVVEDAAAPFHTYHVDDHMVLHADPSCAPGVTSHGTITQVIGLLRGICSSCSVPLEVELDAFLSSAFQLLKRARLLTAAARSSSWARRVLLSRLPPDAPHPALVSAWARQAHRAQDLAQDLSPTSRLLPFLAAGLLDLSVEPGARQLLERVMAGEDPDRVLHSLSQGELPVSGARVAAQRLSRLADALHPQQHLVAYHLGPGTMDHVGLRDLAFAAFPSLGSIPSGSGVNVLAHLPFHVAARLREEPQVLDLGPAEVDLPRAELFLALWEPCSTGALSHARAAWEASRLV